MTLLKELMKEKKKDNKLSSSSWNNIHTHIVENLKIVFYLVYLESKKMLNYVLKVLHDDFVCTF